MAHSRQVFPSITLSAETSACAEFTNPLIISPFDKIQTTTNFIDGNLKSIPEIDKKVATTVMRKALCGLLRIKGYECEYHRIARALPISISERNIFYLVTKGSALLMFLDAMEVFYRQFLEQINHTLTIDGKDITNVSRSFIVLAI